MSILFNWRTMSLLLVIVGVIVLGHVAKYYHDNYQAQQKENAVLVDAVKDRDGTITKLKDAANADRRATEEQLRTEQQKRAKADAENKTLRRALESSDCDHHRMSDDVINILRR